MPCILDMVDLLNTTRARTTTVVLLGSILGVGAAASLAGCVSREVSREQTLVSARTDGDTYLRNGEYNLAAGAYELYLEERPARREVMYDLGRAYEGMGELSAAREAYMIAYELDPFKAEYIDAMARATAANGEIGQAFDLLETIAYEDDRSDAYARLGRFLVEFGFPDEAVLAFETAAEVDPSASSYLEYAEVLAGYKDPSGALKALSHALWFDRESAKAKAMVRRLGGVPGPTFATPPPAP